MALYEAVQGGYRVRCLVTFALPAPDFRAHPIPFIKMQAMAMGVPHYVLAINCPFEQSYEDNLRKLRDEMGIQCVVTGDIAEVNGYPNWIRERSRPVGMRVHTPLWGRDRHTLLRQFLDRGLRARFSCVNTRWLNEDWVGRELNRASIEELQVIRDRTGLDLCGEEGEYHTLVTDGPSFTGNIDIHSYTKRSADLLAYMEIQELAFSDHAA